MAISLKDIYYKIISCMIPPLYFDKSITGSSDLFICDEEDQNNKKHPSYLFILRLYNTMLQLRRHLYTAFVRIGFPSSHKQSLTMCSACGLKTVYELHCLVFRSVCIWVLVGKKVLFSGYCFAPLIHFATSAQPRFEYPLKRL